MSKFEERCSRINNLNAQIISSKLERINYATSYLDESFKCFQNRLRISCIVVSSALVERTLFWQRINFWQEMKLKPLKVGSTMRFPNLGGLFEDFMDWDILRNSLLDTDEQENFRGMKERKAEECDTKKIQKWDRKIRNIFSKARYVETRNLFAHGKELLIRIPLTHLLPADTYASSEYGIDSKEWKNPPLETVAYVHLSKTLRFMKAFTDLLTQGYSS